MTERWITFDCFGTLVDWEGGMRNAVRRLAGDRLSELMEAYHFNERMIETERPHRSYKEVLRRGLQQAAVAVGVDLPAGEADIFVHEWGNMPVFADVEPALSALRRAGWKLAALTNCDEDLFARTLERFPLRFDRVVTAERVGSYKPALGHFEHFERETGVAREQWIHAACSWVHDIAPARRVGIKRVWIDRQRSGHDPAAATRVLHDATQLPETIAAVV